MQMAHCYPYRSSQMRLVAGLQVMYQYLITHKQRCTPCLVIKATPEECKG